MILTVIPNDLIDEFVEIEWDSDHKGFRFRIITIKGNLAPPEAGCKFSDYHVDDVAKKRLYEHCLKEEIGPFATPYVPEGGVIRAKKCTCGAHAVDPNSDMHSDYCDLYQEVT